MQERVRDPQDVDLLNEVMKGKIVTVEHGRASHKDWDRTGVLLEFRRARGRVVFIVLSDGSTYEFEPDILLPNGVSGNIGSVAGRIKVTMYVSPAK